MNEWKELFTEGSICYLADQILRTVYTEEIQEYPDERDWDEYTDSAQLIFDQIYQLIKQHNTPNQQGATMATIIIINEDSDCIMKSVSMREANLIHDMCNHFMDPDGNPNPTAPRQQLTSFQEQKLKEAIREFLIAFGKYTTWGDVELFVNDTQYMSVFDTVNHCDKVFEVSRAAAEWKEDFQHIIESAHTIPDQEPAPTPDQTQIVLNAEVISRIFSKEIFVEEFGTELAPEAQYRLFNLIVDKFLTPMIREWYGYRGGK